LLRRSSGPPHPEAPAGLAKVAKALPLVFLSNASDSQIHRNVEKLGAPFHAVYTAEQAQAYKPRLQAFEYMIDRLGCDPAGLLHVPSSLRYDHMSAYDVGIRHTVYSERGHGLPPTITGTQRFRTLAACRPLWGWSEDVRAGDTRGCGRIGGMPLRANTDEAFGQLLFPHEAARHFDTLRRGATLAPGYCPDRD
jgi:hypothetical protein